MSPWFDVVNLTGFNAEVVILDKHAARELTSGFSWEAGISSLENHKCIIVITRNLQPNTLDSNGSFKLWKDQQVLYNQSIQFLCQTVPRAMTALGEIKSEHVQNFINTCFIIDRFPMRSDANSSKGLTASKDVRRKPCLARMSEGDFVEVSLSFCILLDEKVRAHDKVTLMAVCTCLISKSIRTLIAVCTTHTHTHTDTNSVVLTEPQVLPTTLHGIPRPQDSIYSQRASTPCII